MASESIPTRWKLRYSSELGSLVAGSSTGAFIGAAAADDSSLTLYPMPFAVMALCYLIIGLALRAGKPGSSRENMARFLLTGAGALSACALIAGTGGFNGIEVTPVPAGILAGVLTAAVIICEVITRRRRSRRLAEQIENLTQEIAKAQAAVDARAEAIAIGDRRQQHLRRNQ